MDTYRQRSDRTYDVLLVEPEPDSIAGLVRSFEATTLTNNITVVHTSSEAFDFINQRGNYSETPQPDLVLLNLDLPDASGTELLAELKDRPGCRHIPVLVLTESGETSDVNQAYERFANAYLQKPETADEFDQLARAIEEFWLKLAHLAPKRT
ncbi:response regulator [Natronosalvus vescus]|uniref:response regulator n=1 Tax=Natronosalvus vescus TaxID=2953881 RepID=UPI002091B2D9|nr:response regulator [Natronosalvus vescus]